ncbi:unnamed protein product [Didymodactylos carnosus]|uniref:Chitin-binding type-2 domain-containing protein n=1 Tax=Didymodactylos carnosus TaxID=1234261 RepID=A0A815P2K1_9BILA|nr:unnamed protein product [Didymodactylos carnosus]CAF1443306.1 unnamed protein product [Didymodactylos carnosus]CAF3602499.1 unnamed protein product [Didymodactylos carnosus]CAF4318837.1 unnamed protein product [Didymodactylos carnosus]
MNIINGIIQIKPYCKRTKFGFNIANYPDLNAGLVFNEKKKECDYQSDANGDYGTQCITPRTFLRAKPKAEQGTVLFEGADATGQFSTRFDCSNKDQQNMFADFDWCNIYYVCIGYRDNIFLCPLGTLFNDTKQGCFDRLNGKNCDCTNSYYKPSIKRHKRTRSSTINMPFKLSIGEDSERDSTMPEFIDN